MKKKLTALLLLAILLLTLYVPAFADDAAAPADGRDLLILYTSDIHCGIDEGCGFAGLYAVKLDYQVLIDYITETLGGSVGAGYEEPYGQGRIVSVNP